MVHLNRKLRTASSVKFFEILINSSNYCEIKLNTYEWDRFEQIGTRQDKHGFRLRGHTPKILNQNIYLDANLKF